MRLAVFTNQFPCHTSTFFARDVRTLLEAGCDIDVFAFYPLNANLWRYVPNILSEEILPRAKVHHVGLGDSLVGLRPWPIRKFTTFMRDTAAVNLSAARFGVTPIAKSLYVCLKAWVWATKTHNNYEHILAYWGNYAATCAYIYHRLMKRRIPFSIFLHAGIDLYRDQVYLQQKMLYADNIIVVCDYNQQFVADRYKTIYDRIAPKIHKYHLGLDFAELPYTPDNRRTQTVLAVGKFEEVKGFKYLLHAVHKLRLQALNIELELIGNGELAGSLRHLAKKLKIEDRVTFRGWLPFDQVRAAMMSATIFVLPSLGDAVPTVIKESMGLGIPVIASSVGGIPELLDNGRCGVLVAPHDVTGLAAAIENLLHNGRLRRIYAQAARRYAEEHFDLWGNGRKLAEILRSSTNKKKSIAMSGSNQTSGY